MRKYFKKKEKMVVWLEASYTVEATLILCFLICIIVSVAFIGFYVHDCYITEIAITECVRKENRSVIECSDRLDGHIDWEEWSQKSILWRLFYKDKTDALKKQVEETLEGKLLLSDLGEIQTEITIGKIQLRYKMNIHFPAKWISTILGKRNWSVQNEIVMEEKESEELIRLCRGIKQ